MPRSRLRRKSAYTPPASRPLSSLSSGRWVAPVMVTLFLFGLAWIVVYYIAGQSIPGMRDLNNWNLLIGFGFIAAGFVASTRWK